MARTAGSPNKNKRGLLAELKRQYGKDFHPIMKLADIATNNENDVRLRFDAWKEIAKYTEPQLKAIEMDMKGEVQVNNQISDKPQDIKDWNDEYADHLESPARPTESTH